MDIIVHYMIVSTFSYTSSHNLVTTSFKPLKNNATHEARHGVAFVHNATEGSLLPKRDKVLIGCESLYNMASLKPLKQTDCNNVL